MLSRRAAAREVLRKLLQILTDSTSCNLKNNTGIILFLKYTFAIFKKLGIEANKLEGLLAQATCHAPLTLDQLITAAILLKGDEKPTLTFLVQNLWRLTQGQALCPCQARCANHRVTWLTSSACPAFTMGELVTGTPTARIPTAWQTLTLDQHHLPLIVIYNHLLLTDDLNKGWALTNIASGYLRFNSLSRTYPKKF
ncbi:hypothetical protein O181_094453 [Austropuccinia psidii MF-1]|uniref:Uncharacterized protein n=1 Tax=Austropuccinia psidii MF-1 TaxID=1389203 RepID=A0A9Q3J232_9BASI|nr:hypothetical protein [Austropuccinia psidii MF-1]